MKFFCLDRFIRGWIIGDFQPNIVQTKDFEFGLKKYKKGDTEDKHFHKKAEEITIIINGIFRMNDNTLKEGDIVLVEKNEVVSFECLKNGYTAVLKIPSVKNDKYLCN